MTRSQGRPSPAGARRRVRSVFLSDLHLGCRYSQADALLAFLQRLEPEYLYLVGDIIDGWRLRRSWHWRPVFSRVISRVLELGQAGTQIRYAPGNHDEFLRGFHNDFGFLEIADEFIHVAADGKNYLVLHGDKFDNVELCAPWLSVIGSTAYDSLIWLNEIINRLRGLARLEATEFSAYVKRRVKSSIRFVSDFEQRLTRHARDMDCNGVVCGHIHTPAAQMLDGLAYFNTGDWVEDRSALLEYDDGSMQLTHLPKSADELCDVVAPAMPSCSTSATFRWQANRLPPFDGQNLLQHGGRRPRPRDPCAHNGRAPASRS